MGQKAMVFHVPMPIEDVPRAGSSAHMTHMLAAFRSIGYDVDLVAGHSADRRRLMRHVLDRLASGATYDLVYSEAATSPTVMSDPHHLPLRPLLDWRFLRRLHRAGVPVGLFYPDVYWRFPLYADLVPLHKRLPALAAYRYDLWWYRDVLDVLFLPSLRMAASIPGWESSDRVAALAPGGAGDALPWAPTPGALSLFYVGSVTPPLYDVSPLLRAVRDVEGVHLVVCCPADQAGALAEFTPHDRIQIVHEHGELLRARYAGCDAACLVFGPDSYRSFAMPVKLFEAIGAGRPVIATTGTAVGDFVESTGVGWTVDPDSVGELLQRLVASPDEVAASREAVLDQIDRHSWDRRADEVATRLVGLRHESSRR